MRPGEVRLGRKTRPSLDSGPWEHLISCREDRWRQKRLIPLPKTRPLARRGGCRGRR
jgi:hypothetical protein